MFWGSNPPLGLHLLDGLATKVRPVLWINFGQKMASSVSTRITFLREKPKLRPADGRQIFFPPIFHSASEIQLIAVLTFFGFFCQEVRGEGGGGNRLEPPIIQMTQPLERLGANTLYYVRFTRLELKAMPLTGRWKWQKILGCAMPR